MQRFNFYTRLFIRNVFKTPINTGTYVTYSDAMDDMARIEKRLGEKILDLDKEKNLYKTRLVTALKRIIDLNKLLSQNKN